MGNAISYASLIGIIGCLVFTENNKWYICGILFLISFISKIIGQYYGLFIKKDQKSIAIRIIQGDGLYKNKKIAVFENKLYVLKNDIVTLYCDSSGAPQPICLLRILDITETCIIADQYPEEIVLIDKYFEEDSRRKATYFSKNIDCVFLESLIFDRRQ